MRQLQRLPFPSAEWLARNAPAFMASGLTILLASMLWPAMPVVTAMALVALGATGTTTARFGSAAAARTLVAIHLFVYSSLYLLFIGAVCHAAMSGPQEGSSFFQGLDFGASVAPMALVVRFSLRAIAGGAGGGDAPAR